MSARATPTLSTTLAGHTLCWEVPIASDINTVVGATDQWTS